MKKELIVVGDRILISADPDRDQTEHGLYLPQGVVEKEKIQSGYVSKVGPGYPLPDPASMDDEPWSSHHQSAKYLPLQAEVGDYAIFLRKASVEIEFESKSYLIVPQSAILILARDSFKPE